MHHSTQGVIKIQGRIKFLGIINSDGVLHGHILPNVAHLVGVGIEIEDVIRLSLGNVSKGAFPAIVTGYSMSVKFGSAFAAFPLVG